MGLRRADRHARQAASNSLVAFLFSPGGGLAMTSTSKLVGAVIAGTLALGCSISSSPVIARVESIQITPNRISLVPLQAADLNVMVITSRGVDSSGAAAVLQW